MRTERDSLGEIGVPDDRYYGAQTARSLKYFEIGGHRMPEELIVALLMIKKVAAEVNLELKILDKTKATLIIQAVDRLLKDHNKLDFPLSVWQTGSGTQTNMNVNEVIANLANESVGKPLGSKNPIHPNDDVNKSQSSNDLFPTAMHVATILLWKKHLLPHVEFLRDQFEKKQKEFSDIVKVGRTHMMDAVPMTLGQEFSAFANQLDENIERLKSVMPGMYELAIGGTAVGTGLSAPKEFGDRVVEKLQQLLQEPFKPANNRFAALAAHDAMVFAHGALKTLACSLFKIASDIRLLGSGPKSGLCELILPANEPGSSIMPGKVNPTQCEAMTMVCAQVFGNDAAITFAGSQGHLQLNVFKPVIIYNMIESIKLLSDSCKSFGEHLVEGLRPNKKAILRHVENSLMLVTALMPVLGYDKAGMVAKKALEEEMSLKEAAARLGYLSEAEFDKIVDIRGMAG